MIFYFSGTGNSAWAARQLARLTGDEACDITNLKELPDLANAEQIGFVFPVYAWGAPEIMAEFAKKLPKRQVFTFGVCTCGGNAGLTMKQFSKLYPLSSSYSLRMPNNYIIGSDTDDEGEILQTLTAARKGNADIAIGNIVGSNIFNILFVLGTTALITPVPFAARFTVDTIVAVLVGVLLLVCVARSKKLTKPTGILMLAAYAAYFIYLLQV